MAERLESGTEEAILEAANRCFLRFGLRRTTVEDVARDAGVSRGSVYRYFKDKDTLVASAMVRNADAFFRQLGERLGRLKTFEAKVAEAAVLAQAYRDNDPIYAGLAATEPESFALLLTSQADGFIRAAIEFLAPYVREAKAAGELRGDIDDELAAEWCVRAAMSVIITPGVTFDSDQPAEVKRYIAGFVVRGLKP